MKKNLLISLFILAIAGLSSCTDEEGARKALERNGYKPISVGGYGYFEGSENDVYITRFKAVAVNGDTVTGCVTRGLFKGNTIRTDD